MRTRRGGYRVQCPCEKSLERVQYLTESSKSVRALTHPNVSEPENNLPENNTQSAKEKATCAT